MKLKTRTNQPVYYKLPVSSNIQSLSDDLLNSLRVGDVVQKKTGNQKHCYIVTYKEEKHGICLTYTDCGYMETISYDYTDGHWVFNSKDVKEVLGKGDNIQVNGITSNGDVAISGDLDVSGEGKGVITGNEIIEIMDGYSASGETKENLTYSINYCGAVKTGNKLTLVVSYSVTRTGSVDNNFMSPVEFTLPLSIANKIIPFSSTYVDVKKVSFVDVSAPTVGSVDLSCVILKPENTKLKIRVYNVSSLTTDKTYYSRVEATFLLSDSLID